MKDNIEVSKSAGRTELVKRSAKVALMFGVVLAAALSLAPHAPVIFPAAHAAQNSAEAMQCRMCKR